MIICSRPTTLYGYVRSRTNRQTRARAGVRNLICIKRRRRRRRRRRGRFDSQ